MVRDRAAEFVRSLYGKAIPGTGKETYWEELGLQADPVDPVDGLESRIAASMAAKLFKATR